MKKIMLLIWPVLVQACSSGFLDVKPSLQTVVPTTLDDYALLMNDENTLRNNNPITLNLIGSDEYYVRDAHYNSLSTDGSALFQKNAYTWERTVYTGEETITDWSRGYKRILQCNVVLDGLATLDIASDQQEKYADTKGAALFHRAFAYYSLAQQYCEAYEATSARHKLGLPLRKTADPTSNVRRSTVEETYTFIEADLQEALRLLVDRRQHVTLIEPTKQGAHALLTRLYMQMDDYERAAHQAAACLAIDDRLLDYADYDRTVNEPFPLDGFGNVELIFMNRANNPIIYGQTRMNVSENYLALYEPGDLRKDLFFRIRSGLLVFKGSYTGRAGFWFSGLSRNEVYLNLAESLARLGKTGEALQYLNTLRSKRFEERLFEPYELSGQDQLLGLILEERKRELIFRGIRWEDIRRLNKDPRFRYTLIRTIGDDIYKLEPQSPRFAWPIPPDAIQNGHYEQNGR